MSRRSNQPQLLYVDSREKVSGPTHRASFQLSEAIESCTSARLTDGSVPLTQFNVREGSNTLYLSVWVYNAANGVLASTNDFQVDLTAGFYSADTILIELKGRIDYASDGLTVHCSYDESKHAFSILAQTLRHNGDTSNMDGYVDWFHVRDEPGLGETWKTSVNHLLGFDVHQTPDNLLSYLNSPTNTAGQTSTVISRLLLDEALLLHCSFVQDSTSTGSDPLRQVLARIPSYGGAGEVTVYSSSHTEVASQVKVGSITQFSIWFTNQQGELMDLHGAEWQLAIVLQYD